MKTRELNCYEQLLLDRAWNTYLQKEVDPNRTVVSVKTAWETYKQVYRDAGIIVTLAGYRHSKKKIKRVEL